MSQDAEEVIKRIMGHRGVKSMVVINKEGLPLKSNMDASDSNEQHVRNIHELSMAARRMVRDVDPTDDLLFLRACSNTDEILISPDVNFTVVVIQENIEKPTASTTASTASGTATNAKA